MGDYVFKVKLLLADLSYPNFYYRQSICEDKLNCCFQDLRNELMRRYDLRPSLDDKENYKLQWYSVGDIITISNNDDLNIFMRLKGKILLVVRAQMHRSFYGFNPQITTQFKPKSTAKHPPNYYKEKRIARISSIISNTQTIHKPSPIADSVSLSARVLHEKSGEISKTVELPHQSNSSFVDATISSSVSGIDVSHVVNDRPKLTAKASVLCDSSAIPDSVSDNTSIHVGDDQSKSKSTISNVFPQVTSPIRNLKTAVADIHVEYDQLKCTGNMSLPSDMSSILDSISVNASNVGDDQPKITTADQEIIPQMCSSIPDLRTADENNQPEDSSVVKEIAPQITSPISNFNLRAVDAVVNVENDLLDLRTLDPSVNVENDQHTLTTAKSIIGGQSELFASFPRKTTVSSSVPSHILSHKEVLAKLENMLQYRSKQQQLQPAQHPLTFTMTAPELPTSAPKLSAQAPELSAQLSEVSTQSPDVLTHVPELPTKTVPELESYRLKERSQQLPLGPLNFSLPPELSTPLSQLPEPTKHANSRVQAALNIMTSQMKFSNSGGWLERLLEAVDGDIDEAMRKLQPKMN